MGLVCLWWLRTSRHGNLYACVGLECERDVGVRLWNGVGAVRVPGTSSPGQPRLSPEETMYHRSNASYRGLSGVPVTIRCLDPTGSGHLSRTGEVSRSGRVMIMAEWVDTHPTLA